MIIAAWYYPSRQEKLFKANKENQLRELAKTVALGVELSLKNNDFEGLKKSVDFVSNSSDFEFVSIINQDKITGKENVFITLPDLPKEKVLNRDTARLVYEQYPFDTKDFKGIILIAASKEKINALVDSLNRPLYIILPFILLISLIIFFIIANRISKPIVDLTGLANQLQKGNYEIEIPPLKQNDEIGELRDAFQSLKLSLKKQRDYNQQLTDGLEDEIRVRTKDLQDAQLKLIEAQKIASLGSFEFFCNENKWLLSEGLQLIFGFINQKEYDFDDWLNIVFEEDREDFAAAFHKACKNRVKFKRDFRIIKVSTNDVRWISIVGETSGEMEGKDIFLVGTMQDITDRKIAEAEIDRLSLVAKYTNNLVVITDKNRKIQWVNDSVLNISGYTMEEVIGQTPKMFQFEKTDPATSKYINEKLIKNEIVNTEVLNRGKYGNEYWLELNIVPVFDNKKQLTGYIAVENDISERKLADEKLLKSQEELKLINETLEQKVLENTKRNLDLSKSIIDQEKLATIGEISAGVAHDLNTPLGAIKVGAENVLSTFDLIMQEYIGKCSNEERSFALSYAKQSKADIYVGGLQLIKERKEMLRVLYDLFDGPFENIDKVNELLVKCRVQPNETDFIKKLISFKNPIDVLELIYNLQVVNNLLDTIQTSVEKSVKVIKDIKSFVKTDTSYERVTFSLAENIKTVLNIFNYELKRNVQLHFDIDGKIFIYGYEIKLFQLWSNLIKNAIEAMDEKTGEKYLRVYAEQSDGHLNVIVENTGDRIKEEIIDKVFKKFFTTKQSRGGTGLGLSIVKNVADEHGARIYIDSNDVSTKFIITFKQPYYQIRQF
ncbi:MAG: PAS domain S-box protein [Bacteroidota bacterium]